MKINIVTLMMALALLCSCQSKTNKTEVDSKEKSCCSDTTKSCSNKGEAKSCCSSSDSISMTGVQVVYFHNERRCATCMAVEEGAADVVKTLGNEAITFKSYLFGDPQNAELEKKWKVEGQILLIIGKGQIIDFTNQAFLNARVKPVTYKEELKAEIEKLK
jgi:hypothetical protein